MRFGPAFTPSTRRSKNYGARFLPRGHRYLLSERRIFELQAKNVILRAGRGEIDLDLARISYIRHLRDKASGRQTPGEFEHMGPESDHAVRRTNVLRGPMNPNRLAETEDTLAHTDRLWRSEMKR